MKIVVNYYLSEEGKKRAAAAGLEELCEQEISFDDPENSLEESVIGVTRSNEPDTLCFDLRRRGLMIWENSRRNYYLKDFHYYPLSFTKEQWREFLGELLRLYGLTQFNVQMGVNNYLDEPITSLADLHAYDAQEQETIQRMEDLVVWINGEYARLNLEIHEQAKKAIAGFAAP